MAEISPELKSVIDHAMGVGVQNLTASQQLAFAVDRAAAAKEIELILTVGAEEARGIESILGPKPGTVAEGQQGLKAAQSSLPETGQGGSGNLGI